MEDVNFSKLISTVDMHVEGEPLRIITGGIPQIKGENQQEKRAYCIEHLDYIRQFLMYEPRGHEGMYGCIITPPSSEGSDFGVLFMHNEGWSTMCGHGIIAVITMKCETEIMDSDVTHKDFKIDTPAGLVRAKAKLESGKIHSVSFKNVDSFVYLENLSINVNDINLEIDVVFSGAFYVIVNNQLINLEQEKCNLPYFQKWGKLIKEEVENNYDIQHPLQSDLQDIYGVIFSEKSSEDKNDWKNITIFADCQIDRSPCGTGTGAKAAQLFSKGLLKNKEILTNQSITKGVFKCEIFDTSKVNQYKAVVPEITGKASISSFNHFVLDEKDAQPNGFLLK